ncbi:Actin-1 [Diplonema papillatum]|nr:Actin-1 [Diplonema papillatum]
MAGNDGALPTLVVDVGSASVKCGFGGEDAPRKVFPTVLGWPRHPGLGGVMLGGKKDNFVGEEAASRAGVLRVVHPVQRGEIVDWNEMDKLLYHVFYSELVVAPDEHPLLFMESPGVEKSAREKLAQLHYS